LPDSLTKRVKKLEKTWVINKLTPTY